MTAEHRRENVRLEVEKSRRTRTTADRTAGDGDYDAAVNRLYYAAFHAARAVCLTGGLEAKSHRGLKHLLALHFVHAGLLPDWAQTVLSRLETERDLADYALGEATSREGFELRREETDRFLAEVEGFLSKGGWI
ncbi:MAG: HEPN domain-containing protein [Planctomycetes bacterium]|nr:HEPN domain-containing protein [Planctomycetota bacterium]